MTDDTTTRTDRLVGELKAMSRAMGEALLNQLPPELARLEPCVILEVDNECAVIDIAQALASVGYTVQWTGVPNRGRIVLSERARAVRNTVVNRASEAARQRDLERGVD